MISSIVLVPALLLQDYVIPFLEIVDLVWLDTAVMNHKVRTQFLEQIQGVRLKTATLPIDNHTANWLLYRKMRITDLCVSTNALDLSLVKQLAPSVYTHISLENCHKVTREAMIDFVKSCQNVKSLGLNTFCCENTILESISQNCSALQTLHLSDISVYYMEQITVLIGGCRMLFEINIKGCCWISDEFIVSITEHCPQLQKLSLDYCCRCKDRTLQALAEHCHDLRYLSLGGVYQLTDVGVCALAAGCVRLKTCLLYGSITSAGIITLAQGCSELEEVDIPECDEHVDEAVAALVQHCPALNTIRCYSSHFTDMSLQYLRKCSLLLTLHLENADITSTALMEWMSCCPHLQSLKISVGQNFGYEEYEVALSDPFHRVQSLSFCDLPNETYIQFIAKCPNITELHLDDCGEPTDDAVLAVVSHCNKLQKLNLHDIFVSNNAFANLVQSCPDLHYIRTFYCGPLSDTATRAIAQHCPYLRCLDMSYCFKLTDIGIVEILQRCHQLRELELCYCDLITSKVLGAAVQYGARLRSLDISGCPKVDVDDVMGFRSAKPKCKLRYV